MSYAERYTEMIKENADRIPSCIQIKKDEGHNRHLLNNLEHIRDITGSEPFLPKPVFETLKKAHKLLDGHPEEQAIIMQSLANVQRAAFGRPDTHVPGLDAFIAEHSSPKTAAKKGNVR